MSAAGGHARGRGGASAPGKALLCGEYAVLDGAPAIVMAVDRRARAHVIAGQPAERSEFVARAVEAARRLLAERPGATRPPEAIGEIAVDSAALRGAGGAKLGLGSSAAVTVAAAGALLDRAGVALDDPGLRARLLKAAAQAHAAAQGGRGSGVDVAAAVYGGWLRFVRGAGGGPPVARPVEAPAGLAVRLYATGAPVATSPLLARVRAFIDGERGRAAPLLVRLRDLAEAFAAAVAAGDAAACVRAADRYGQALAALGDAAGAPIVPGPAAALAEAARRLGAAAKPSGASGAELVVTLSAGAPDTAPATAAALDRAAADAGFVPLAAPLDRRGLVAEPPAEPGP